MKEIGNGQGCDDRRRAENVALAERRTCEAKERGLYGVGRLKETKENGIKKSLESKSVKG